MRRKNKTKTKKHQLAIKNSLSTKLTEGEPFLLQYIQAFSESPNILSEGTFIKVNLAIDASVLPTLLWVRHKRESTVQSSKRLYNFIHSCLVFIQSSQYMYYTSLEQVAMHTEHTLLQAALTTTRTMVWQIWVSDWVAEGPGLGPGLPGDKWGFVMMSALPLWSAFHLACTSSTALPSASSPLHNSCVK